MGEYCDDYHHHHHPHYDSYSVICLYILPFQLLALLFLRVNRTVIVWI